MQTDRDKAITDQLVTLLEEFRASPEVSRLLKYLVEKKLKGETLDLTERSIAKRVFSETLLPGSEKGSRVRTHASNLRAAISRYYLNKGCNDEVIISLPPKGYHPVVIFRSDSALPVAFDGRPSEEERGVYKVIYIRAKAKDMPVVFSRLYELLKDAPGDPTISLGRTGSVLIYLRCSEIADEWLMLAWLSGELVTRIGFPIEDIQPADASDAALLSVGNPALHNCITSPFELSSASGLYIPLLVSAPFDATLSTDGAIISIFYPTGSPNLAPRMIRLSMYEFSPTVPWRKVVGSLELVTTRRQPGVTDFQINLSPFADSSGGRLSSRLFVADFNVIAFNHQKTLDAPTCVSAINTEVIGSLTSSGLPRIFLTVDIEVNEVDILSSSERLRQGILRDLV